MIKASDDLSGLFDHGKLILPHRHGSGLKCGDIGSLADGIGKKSHRDAGLKISQFDLVFHCRIPLESGHSHQVHVVKGQFRQFRDLGLDKQGGLLRVQAAGEIIQGHLDDVLSHLLRVVRIVRQCLGIGYHDEDIVKISGFLKLHTPF